MDYCHNSSIQLFSASVNQSITEDVSYLYKYLCPILLTGCLVGLILNVVLVMIANLRCIHKSPIFRLSLNLATTDAINSLIIGIGLFFNSYLPQVFNIYFTSRCSLLILEIFRLSSLVSSALHLLAMAIVYYRGTANPFHYRSSIFFSAHLTRSIYLVSILCWALPITLFSIYFSSIPCQGFQSGTCETLFMLSFRFRITITIIFITPLILMFLIYVRIFSIIIKSRKEITLTVNSTTNERQLEEKATVASVAKQNQLRQTVKVDIINNNKTATLRSSRMKIPSYPRKALFTTLTILGTYVICWMPAVMYYAITCLDGCPYPLLNISNDIRVIIGFVANAFIIAKAIVDPFIYSFRMKEINTVFNSSTHLSRSFKNLRNTNANERER